MSSYPELAASCGIALPPLLARLIDAGLAGYGPDVKAWVANWKAHTLAAQPVLSCVYDLEWIPASEAAENIEEWLNPVFQQGRRFLPFAQTGAGDLYCLMPLANGDIGVALAWHDSGDCEIQAASFDAFIYGSLVRSAADISHLIDGDFTVAEAALCLASNIDALSKYLPEPHSLELERIRALALSRAQAGEATLISQDTAQAALALLPVVQDAPFELLARWECGQA
ncbi:SMI1/KNR4 family protein [Achromobacter seleniivolatilans]|uniref:SMI1/KNR4 family protein n=1 Tax=Achromobacter seleniivolatilans TaxID=3047478 RepID=A0ABY9M7E3_9BURK|nr:SMI1/KNR4 family protein [Achromobacter sp. R39]WMD21722.1 SMI1/KNR4 family protein [Achromobacter sp. R39]